MSLISCRTIPDWAPPEERYPVRVAVVGAGKMARLHGQTLKALPGVSLSGVSSRSEASSRRLKLDLGFERAYTDYERMLDELRPDAVFVAVSHSMSFQVGQAVVARGIPVLLEKPTAFSLAQVRQLADSADRAGTITMVGLNRRFYSVIQQACLAVMQQGPVRGVHVEAHEPTLDYRARMQFEGWLYDRWLVANSIHAIDLLRMIGGEVGQLAGFGCVVNEPCGDHFSITTRHGGGILGSFVAHWNSAGGMSMKIYGDGVVAELENLECGFIHYASGRRIKIQPDEADQKFKPGVYAQNLAFLRSVCEGSAAPFPASDLADNVRTMELVERILETAVAQ